MDYDGDAFPKQGKTSQAKMVYETVRRESCETESLLVLNCSRNKLIDLGKI